MSENKLMKDTLLLCDNLISQYVGRYTDDIFGIVKRAQVSSDSMHNDDKTLKLSISSQLIDIAKSIDETTRIDRMFCMKYDCGFMFGQCFVEDVDQVISNITAIEFATTLKDKKRIAGKILEEHNWDVNLTPGATIILLEKHKNKIINDYAKDIYARIEKLQKTQDVVSLFDMDECVDKNTIAQHLEYYTKQKQLNRRQCKQLIRKYSDCNISFWLTDFNKKISEVSHKKHSIEFTPEESKAETINRVRSRVVNEKIY